MQNIKPEIIVSDDGSSTLRHPIIGDMYHSIGGAVSESMHIYINEGLHRVSQLKKRINILEIGFGSGLNALLTIEESIKNDLQIEYTTIELYPIDLEVIKNLKYDRFCSPEAYEIYLKAHQTEWNKKVKLTDNFTIEKINKSLLNITLELNKADVVYFDAFAPTTQPELWSIEVFGKIYASMQKGGILVTYSAKGVVKQALREVGFEVKRVKGALGKHHMLVCFNS